MIPNLASEIFDICCKCQGGISKQKALLQNNNTPMYRDIASAKNKKERQYLNGRMQHFGVEILYFDIKNAYE